MFHELEMIEKNCLQNMQNMNVHQEIEKMEKIFCYLKRNVEDPEVFNLRFLLQEKNALNEFMKYFETIKSRISEFEKNKTGSVFEKISLFERDQK